MRIAKPRLMRHANGMRIFPGFLRSLFGLFLVLSLGAEFRAEALETYQLLTTGRELSRGEAIGVRFTAKMVANPADIDLELSPVELQPPVPFSFEWLSSQTGRVVFTQAPALSTKLRILPKNGLRTASGELIVAPDEDTLTRVTPAYGLLDAKNTDVEREISADVSLTVSLNFEPVPASLNAGVLFVSDRGEAVRAKIEPYQRQYQWETRLLTWSESFSPAYRGKTQASNEGKNKFTFTPVQGLLPHRRWSLQFGREVVDVISPNILPFPTPYRHTIGRVEELVVKAATYKHEVLGQQEIRVEFNKALSSPGELSKVRLDGAQIRWSFTKGASLLIGTIQASPGQLLKLSVPPGLIAADGTKLTQSFSRDLRVEGLPARLYFDDFVSRQFSTGVRKLPLMGVNVESVKLRVQRIPASQAALAMKRWSEYRIFEDKNQPSKNHNRFEEEFTGVNQKNRRIEISLPESATVCSRVVPLETVVGAQAKEALLSWDELIGARESGMFLVTAEAAPNAVTGARVGAQTLVQLTDIGLVSWIHQTGGGATCHVYSLGSGKPLEGVECVFFDGKYEPVERGISDAKGIVTATTSAARWMAASLGADVTTLSLNYWNEVEADNEPEGGTLGANAAAPTQAFLFLDRDIYRPGETLHAKAFFRDIAPGGLKVPEPFEFSVKVVDDRDREILQTKGVSSREGSWTMDIPLPERVGTYHLFLSRNSDPFAAPQECHFTIATFEEDKFQLNVLTAPEVAAAQPFNVHINAAYLSGQPLSAAKGVWTLKGTPGPFSPQGFDGFTFNFDTDIFSNDGVFKEAATVHSLSQQGQVTFDAKGASSISLDLRSGRRLTCPVSLEFGLEVTDASQQTLFNGQSVYLHASDFYLGVAQMRSWVHSDQDVPWNVVAIGTDGRPVQPVGPVELTVERIAQSKVLYDADGETKQVTRYTLTPVSKQTVVVMQPERLGDRWILDRTKSSALLRFKQGRYIISVRTFDSGQRLVETRTLLNVGSARTATESAARATEEDENEESVFTIVPDKESSRSPYCVGDSVQLLIVSEKPGNALLTVQSGKVLRTQLIALTQRNTQVEVPLRDTDVPQVRLNLTRMRGLEQSLRKVKTASLDSVDTTIHVIPADSKLGVTVTGLPEVAVPRTPLHPEVRVTRADGTAAAESEVTLYAVDEGVLRMSAYKTPEPIRGIFEGYLNRLYRVANYRAFQSEAHDAREGYYNKGFIVGGGGDGDGDVRGNFPLTVLWIASGKTDTNGKLRVEFKAPENLSKFRVMAVVAHGASAFGSGDASFRIQKNIQIQSGTPQIARVGDKLWLRAIVQNATSFPAEIDVTLKTSEGVLVSSGTSKRLLVAANSTEPVEFEATFSQVGNAVLQWRVRGTRDEGGDAMESRIEVEHATPVVTETYFVKLEPGTEKDMGGVSPLLLTGESRVTVQVSAMGRAQLHQRARMLLHYPYGCAEQTVSSTLPWLLAGELRLPEVEPSKVEKMLAKGVARLESMQTGSGGIAYWPKSTEPMPFVSAYAGVLVALIEEHERGSSSKVISATFRSQLVGYLKSIVRTPEGAETQANMTSQCLALCALAALHEPELGAQEKMLGSAAFLADDERTFLALAVLLSQTGKKTAKNLLEKFGNRESADDFGSLERDKALRVLAWTKLGGVPESETSLLGELLAAQNNGLGSTQANAWVLLVLSKVLPPESDAFSSGSGRVEIQGKQSSFSFAGSGRSVAQSEISADWSAKNTNPQFRIHNDSSGPIFALVTISKREQNLEAHALRQGYSLNRTFEKLDAQNVASPAVGLKPGDRVRVKLEVTAHQGGAYLALNCPIPANLEPIQAFVSRQSGNSARAGRDSFSDYREIRSNGIVCFQNLLRKGTYVVEVVTRVRAAGDAVAPAARIEEMYHPERFGQTAGQRMTVGR